MDEPNTKPDATREAEANGRAERRSGNLLTLIARIEEGIEAETAALRSDPRFDLKASNARKSRHLHELNRAFKSLNPDELGMEQRAAITRLRETLAANEATIQAHMHAVGEVATLLQEAIERAHADGTYSVHEFGQR